MPDEPLSDMMPMSYGNLNEKLQEYELYGDDHFITVDRTPVGRIVRFIGEMPTYDDRNIIATNYIPGDDQYEFSWLSFDVPVVRAEPETQVVYETVASNAFKIDATDYDGTVSLWLGNIDSTLQMFWSYSGSATGADDYTAQHMVEAVDSKKRMGVPFRISNSLTSGTAPTIAGDNTAIPTINFLDDLAFNYNSGDKEVTIYLNKWNPGLVDGGAGLFSASVSLGDDFNDTIILGWNKGTSSASLDVSANASSYTYTRDVATFATGSTGNLTHGWVDGAAQAQFGISNTSYLEYTNAIDTDTVDEVTFDRWRVDWKIRNGVIEQWDDTDIDDVVLTADNWVGWEAGGKVYHKDSPVSSEGDADHWVTATWTTAGGLSVDGASVTVIELLFDRKGHLWGYDEGNGTTGQPSVTNYRYRHCSDYPSVSDLIFAAQSTGTVIEVNGDCYEYVGTTEEDVTAGPPTINATYSNCTSCEGGGVNAQWRYCSDNSTAVVIGVSTMDDFAWLCIGGTYKKCYYDGLTAAAATTVTYLQQCGDEAPTQCSDLVGWPASDDFGGTGCNSGAVGDTNWGIRWAASGTGTPSITGGALSVSMPGGGTGTRTNTITSTFTRAGDFSWTIDTNVGLTGTANQSRQQRLYINGGAVLALIGGNTQYSVYADINGTNNTINNIGTGSVGWSIVRASGTITIKYNGNTIVSASYSADVTSISLITLENNISGTMAAWSGTFDNHLFTDGSSGDIYIDPSGKSCT